MDRRALLSGSALLVGLSTISSGNVLAQQTADIEGVKSASKAFYDALAILDDGTAMSKIWAQTPYVTYVSPSSKSAEVGWEALRKIWANTSRYAKRDVSVAGSHIHVNGNLGWEVGVEVGQVALKDGRTIEINALVTNVYERVEGRWLIVSHHASQKPT